MKAPKIVTADPKAFAESCIEYVSFREAYSSQLEDGTYSIQGEELSNFDTVRDYINKQFNKLLGIFQVEDLVFYVASKLKNRKELQEQEAIEKIIASFQR
jgi:hypothetical protein